MDDKANLNLELFDHTGASKADKRPYISLQVRGSFQINRAAYELMGKPQAIHLLYDRERSIVGFRPAKEGERASYTVRTPNPSTFSVSGQAFVNHYELELTQTRRYVAERYGDVVIIDLNKPDAISSRKAKSFRDRQR
jgi:hypothetical protein